MSRCRVTAALAVLLLLSSACGDSATPPPPTIAPAYELRIDSGQDGVDWQADTFGNRIATIETDPDGRLLVSVRSVALRGFFELRNETPVRIHAEILLGGELLVATNVEPRGQWRVDPRPEALENR